MRKFNVFPTHTIAKRLLEIDPNIKFSVHLLYSSNSHYEHYIKNQCEINYEQIITTQHLIDLYKNDALDMDFLIEAEKKYGDTSLWYKAFLERDFIGTFHYEPCHKYSEEEILRWIQATIKHIEHVIEVCKPDYWFDIFTVQFIRQAIVSMCKYHGISWLRPQYSRVGSYAAILNTNLDIFPYIERYKEIMDNKELSIEEGEKAVKAFCKSNKSINNNYEEFPKWIQDLIHPDTLSFRKKLKKISFFISIYKLLIDQIDYIVHKKEWRQHHRTRPPSVYIGSLIRQFINKKMIKISGLPRKNYEVNTPFFLFALITIPEEQTEIRSPIFSDEYFLIRVIAQSLPIDCILYVKEHRTMFLKRPHSFYRKIEEIPKVKVLDAFLPIIPLIKKAEAVITIGGTVGFEAIFHKKPVIYFGQVGYDIIDYAVYVKDVRDLPNILKKARELSIEDRSAPALMQAILDTCFKLNLQIWNQTVLTTDIFMEGPFSEDIKVLARELHKKIVRIKGRIQ